MAIQVQLRRGTTAQNNAFTGAVGEVTVDTDKDTAVVHDGATAGGFPLVGEKGAQTITGVKTFANGLATDTISEETSAAGVTIDGVLLKDSQVTTDQINEKTSAAGVTIDGVLLKDSQVTTDQINEKTSAAGVTIDSVLLKDGTVKATTTIGVGNATPAASGAGITFPATQSASSDANTLDDYEEGTWTPELKGSSVSGSQTYGTRHGGYTKIGRQVTLNFFVQLTAKGTIAGDISLSNLPFATANDNNAVRYGKGHFGFVNLATNWASLGSLNDTNLTELGINGIKTAAGTLVLLTATDLNNDSMLYGSVVYNAA
jgi:hypothetical protein